MSRRENRNRQSNNISMWLLGGACAIIITAFILAYVLYSSELSRQAKTNNTQLLSETEENNMLNMVTNVENSQEVSSSIGKTVDEMENAETNQETVKVAVNTSGIEENKTAEKNNNQDENQDDVEDENMVGKNEEQNQVAPSFIAPVEGEIVKDYSKDNLIYSNTLDEWTTHLGIDYAAEKTDVVKASADGIIKSIKNDPRYGLTVVIEHSNGFESIYSSLLTAEFITVGEEVKQGQTIATVGNTAVFEIADETHLHFEIKQNGENVDPNIYIK